MLADEADDKSKVMASLASGQPDPELGTSITLHCTVKLQKLVSGTGQPSMEPSLDGCAKLRDP